jgi:hypothetical protein
LPSVAEVFAASPSAAKYPGTARVSPVVWWVKATSRRWSVKVDAVSVACGPAKSSVTLWNSFSSPETVAIPALLEVTAGRVPAGLRQDRTDREPPKRQMA